jgi:ATP-dependent Clp protease ATP-binding subunit ClpB
MLTSRTRLAVSRIGSSVPRIRPIRPLPPCLLSAPRASQPNNLIRPIAIIRHYAKGRPHPPGGTHTMNLGGEPEKPALEQYGVDLTERARDGKLDPVIGRDQEIQRTIQILSRRTKNNPVVSSVYHNIWGQKLMYGLGHWFRWHRKDRHPRRTCSTYCERRCARVDQG